ncbi:MAG TPA: hypothetical protein VFR58_12510 [Flavisolibacter sp.]|nr:hypothetical protein [Flavisolibacter sp.]
MEGPKIQLSSAESELMQNAAVILTKNSVLQKLGGLLKVTAVHMQHFAEQSPLRGREPFLVSPKISKGENYLGLPYLILDYPRTGGGQDLFFIRSMFWWGRLFSSTLHLSGRFKESHASSIGEQKSRLSDYYIATGEDQWAHHFEPSNYSAISGMEDRMYRAACAEKSYLKIARKWPLEEWNDMPELWLASWKELLAACRLIA